MCVYYYETIIHISIITVLYFSCIGYLYIHKSVWKLFSNMETTLVAEVKLSET